MEKVKKFLLDNLHWLVVVGVAILCAIFLIVGHTSENGQYITLDGSDAQISEGTREWIEEAQKSLESTMVYSENEKPAIITNSEGEEETLENIPTVESVDSGKAFAECLDGEECGLGAYVYVPVDTYTNFKNYVLGKCIDVDGAFGAQCYDLAAAFWMNYTNDGRTLSTCNTGAARGAWDCKEQNAGSEFDLVYNSSSVVAGDWIIFGGGTWGHVCMAMGPANNGYVTCLGENQAGTACPGGGAAANIINISLKDFRGAFRPKTYIQPSPTPPAPEPTPVTPGHKTGDKVTYTYVVGDYFSKVLVNLGLDEGNLWGNEGSVQYYTNQLIQQDMLDHRGNVKLSIPFTLTVR